MLRRVFLALAVVIAVSAVGQDFKLHATKYHPGQGGAGWVTASGDRINYDKLKNYQIRWVALSQPRMRKRIDFLTPRGDKYNFRNGSVTIRKKKKD